MRNSARRAFTLVEIMIVIAIIGIIIAIAVPAFLRARESSRAMACQENLTKIDAALNMYAMEFKKSTGFPITYPDDLVNPAGSPARTGFLRQDPVCPSSGTYGATAIGAKPTCTIGAANPQFPHVIPAS